MIRDKILDAHKRWVQIEKEIEDLLEGVEVEIQDKYYNGQPFGTSKKSLQGKRFIPEIASLDYHNILSLWDGNWDHCHLTLAQVKFEDEF